ncbi:MAG: VWA domain-containing protein [Rhodanobacteraceae bacterium]|nr:VWA domain-containing protein [Rhodanobacteraceae bacterium]
MYPRKSLTLAITAGLMFGIGACSMQEKSQTKKEGHTVKDDRAAVSEHDEGRQDALSGRDRINAMQIESPPAPPAPPAPPPLISGVDAKFAAPAATTSKIAREAVAIGTIAAPPVNQAQAGDINRENYADHDDNAVMRVAEQPVSTFSIDVDTGSYTNVRRMLNDGQLPPRDAVRAEEFINYFDYAYAPPVDRKTPFAVHTEVAPTPWNARHQLMLVGIKGYEIAASEIPAANIVFLIDSSGSMGSPDKIGLLKQSFMAMVPRLREQDRISIVVYAGSAGLVLPPTSGAEHETILAAFDRLSAGGSTNGAAGIELAYQQAKRAYIEGGVNRVILATDGDFNVGTVDMEALKTLVAEQRRSGVSLTTLGFGQGNYNDELSEQLADIGNGNHAYIDTLNEGHKVLVEEMSSTLFTIAKDVKIQVEFNPAVVAEYRLIGYENRMLATEDFNNDAVDAGEIGAGHDVTAIYEVVLAGSGAESVDPLRYGANATIKHSGDELAFVKLRYKQPDADTSTLIERPIKLSEMAKEASPRLQFAAAVAAFADRLRGGEHLGQFDLAQIAKLANAARNDDRFGYQREFVDLVNRAQALSGEAQAIAVVSE